MPRSLALLVALVISSAAPVHAQAQAQLPKPIPEWLVLGPVPYERDSRPFESPAQKEIVDAAPTEGDSTMISGVSGKWTKMTARPDGEINLLEAGFDRTNYACAYLLAYIYSQRDQNAT